MPTNTEPCSWPIADAPPGDDCPGCGALERLDDTYRELAISMATSLLWHWTGRRFGLCETVVRPCRASCSPRASTYYGSSGRSAAATSAAGWTPALIGGQWFNIGCGVCSTVCSCSPDRLRTLELPGPVHSITEVWVDGARLPETAYELRDGILYRVDGGVWPECNDDIMSPRVPDSAAWEVVYQRGYPVPAGGQVAAYMLACQFALVICGSDECVLPDNVKSITRQGVSMEISTTEFRDTKDGATGIWLIDSWVASVNAPVPARPQIFSPDIPAGYMRGTAAGLAFGRRR